MSRTLAEGIEDARVILQDTVEERYSDAELIRYFNNGFAQLKRMRPDSMLIYIGTQFPVYTNADLAANLPMDDIYYDALVFYVSGYAKLRDSEAEIGPKMQQLLQSFAAQLVQPFSSK